MAGEITEFTEPRKDHCLESDDGSTTVQIDIVGRSPRLTQHSHTHAVCGRAFGVCNLNIQKDQRRGITKKRSMMRLVCRTLLLSLLFIGVKIIIEGL